MKSAIGDGVWPRFPTDGPSALSDLLDVLNRTKALSDHQLEQAQGAQLQALVEHSVEHSAYFRERMMAAGLVGAEMSSMAALARLPILTRREMQSNEARMRCRWVPESHLPLSESGTSGSMGEPVVVVRTSRNFLFSFAFTIREHHWQKRDATGKLAVLRAHFPETEQILPSWGAPVALFEKTGQAYTLRSNRPVEEQADWLEKINPDYMLLYATNLSALIDEFERRGEPRPLDQLRQLRTVGETVSPHLRRRAAEILKAPIADVYSSEEFGTIAIQSPCDDLYHIMAESYIVEVLDEKGTRCREGEFGKLVVTDLQNFAMPLIRYDTGDYAVAGSPLRGCEGLPTLQRILGRERNMAVIGGTKRWPTLDSYRYREFGPIRQYQLVQHTAQLLEVKLVVDPLAPDKEAALRAFILERLEFPFEVRFTYLTDRLPLGKTGKFEEFLCLVK